MTDPAPPKFSIRDLVSEMRLRRLPPEATPDPFVAAWHASDDLEQMIELLRVGAAVGVYGFEGQTRTDASGCRWIYRLQTPEGRYVRVDVTERGGADQLREAVPDIAPRSVWYQAIEDERQRVEDPIDLLLMDLRRLGHADPRWFDARAFADAWNESTAWNAMLALLTELGRDDLREDAQRAIDDLPIIEPPHVVGDALGGVFPHEFAAMDRYMEALAHDRAKAVRRAVPRVPDPPRPPGTPPERLLARVEWTLSETPLSDPSAVEQRLVDGYGEEIRDWLHRTAIEAPKLTVIFEPWDQERADRVPTSAVLHAPNGTFTNLELVFAMHNAVAEALARTGRRLGDHRFVESADRHDDASTPTYYLTLGS